MCLPAMCKSSLFLMSSSLLRSIYIFEVVFHPTKVVFNQRTSSIKGRLQSKGVFHQRLSFIKGCFPSRVVLHQRSSFIKGRLPSNRIFTKMFVGLPDLQMSLSLKFCKDPRCRCGYICKTILTFKFYQFSMYFAYFHIFAPPKSSQMDNY